MINKPSKINKKVLKEALKLMSQAKSMTELYEEQFSTVSKYVHATSRGAEAVQIALGLQLTPNDYVAPYYRDDALIMAIGMKPYDLMLQLLAKKTDPFSGGRLYYSHPALRDKDKPTIILQTSATGMQAIPSTGIAMGLDYKNRQKLATQEEAESIVVCCLGDASVTEGEVSEAFQVASLRRLPILYLVEDNGWDISAKSDEVRSMNVDQFAKGFNGIEALTIDGTNFEESYLSLQKVIMTIRKERRPFIVRANVALLNHHTSGVRKEWYRDDLIEHALMDPFPKLKKLLKSSDISTKAINNIIDDAKEQVLYDFEQAQLAPEPTPEDLYTHDFAPTPIKEELGDREPKNGEVKMMVDCALFALKEIFENHPESLLYGQDVGKRLGGVFRESAMLAEQFGNERVFNTAIQEAFIVGSTVGMSAVGLKPIVEVQFADYLWPGLNQLFTEVSRSYYLSNGKFPVSMVLRVPIGAYGSGGPYHSSSIESVLTSIHGIKIAYPSNGADLKGLMKAAFYDPNPVVILEHKGLYWSKAKGTEMAKSIMPADDYILPLGKGNMVLTAIAENIDSGDSVLIISYGMGVHWAYNAAKEFKDNVSILDLRTLYPLDTELIYEQAKKHGRILVITEEPVDSSFAQSISARIQENCWEYLEAPVLTLGSKNMPAIPLNQTLERTMLLSIDEIKEEITRLLFY